MNIKKHVLVPVLLGVAAIAAGCAKEGSATPQKSAVAAEASTNAVPEVLATIGDEKVTLDDVRERMGHRLDRIESQYMRARSEIIQAALDTILTQKILGEEAKKQGKTVDELVVAEAGGNVNPTSFDISNWYSANIDKVGGRTLDQVSTQIADFLRNEKRTAAAQKLMQRLNQEKKVAVFFKPYRFTFQNEGAPTLGGKSDAPVTLVEFSDFQCPFCNRFAPTLKQIEKKYGDKVQIVYRQYPIASIHPFAPKAAEASLCAHDQGKFWVLHDKMFEDQTKLAVSDIKEQAAKLGIDRKKFDACLDGGKYVEQVQNDLREGSRVGVTGTPAIFINGMPLAGGAVPFEVVAAEIDKELTRTSAKAGQ